MAVALVLPLAAKRKKAAVRPAVVLSAEDSRRYDYFFLEAQRQNLKGNYAEAYDLLTHCLEINPQAAETYYQLALYHSAMDKDSLSMANLQTAVALRPDNKTYLEALANNYYKQKNYAKAAAVYEQLARNSRDRSDLQRTLLSIYERQKDYGKMISCLNRLEQMEGSGEDITLSKVHVYELLNDRKSALKTLRQLVDEHPFDLNYQVMMGNWLMQNGSKAEALRLFADALKKEPTNTNVLGSLYDYYKDAGQDTVAYSFLRRILTSPKTEAESRMLMMKRFIKSNEKEGGDSVRVLALFDQIAKTVSLDASMAELRLAYMKLKHMPDSVVQQSRNQLLRVAPDNAPARFETIQQLWTKQKWDEVARLSKEGTEYNPDEMGFYYFLGLSYYQKEQNDSALNAFRKGVDVVNDDSNPAIVSDFYSLMGTILQDKGQYAQAYDAFDKSLKWKSDNTECLNNYAYFLSVRDTALTKAAQMSYKTIQAEPKNSTFLDTYAWILFRQSRYAEAKIYIDQAVANDTDSVQSAVILEHAGDIYMMNKQTDKAIDYWQRAVKAGSDSPLLPKKIQLKKYIEDEKKTK